MSRVGLGGLSSQLCGLESSASPSKSSSLCQHHAIAIKPFHHLCIHPGSLCFGIGEQERFANLRVTQLVQLTLTHVHACLVIMPLWVMTHNKDSVGRVVVIVFNFKYSTGS